MKPVLVSHSGIGNLLHLTPLAQALHEYNGEKPTILTWQRSFPVLERWEHADVWCADPAEYFKRAAATHVYLQPAGAWWNQVPALKDKKLPGLRSASVFEQSPGKRWEKHEAEYAMDFARWLGYQGETPAPSMPVPKVSQGIAQVQLERVNRLDRPFVCINASYLPNEHWPMKHWGDKNYSALAIKLRERGMRSIFVGSKDDQSRVAKIIYEANIGDVEWVPVNLCGFSGDIKDTAAIIQRAALTIGNDGGLQHVSAAVGTPTLTIFTFTNPIKNRPLGEELHHRIVARPCDERISCQHGQWKECAGRGCLDVPIEEVWQETESLLDLLLGEDGAPASSSEQDIG